MCQIADIDPKGHLQISTTIRTYSLDPGGTNWETPP